MPVIISWKELGGWIVTAVLIGTVVPLLGYPLETWWQFFEGQSIVFILNSSGAYYAQWIFWTLTLVLIIKAVTA